MFQSIRRIGRNFRNRRYLDAYAVSLVAFALAVVAIIGETMPDNLRWATLFTAVGLLVYRITVPETTTGDIDHFLKDRAAFVDNSLSRRLASAREIWIFAPSAANILSASNCEQLRLGPLSRPEGSMRVVVIDPSEDQAVRLAIRQLDYSLDYPMQQFRESLDMTVRQLRMMSDLPVRGNLQYRFIDYNPGFSLVVVDPSGRSGKIIVEFHGFHNESTSARMHFELHRAESENWYRYWLDQFEHIWRAARIPQS